MAKVHLGKAYPILSTPQIKLHLAHLDLNFRAVVLHLQSMTDGTLHVAIQLFEQSLVALCHLDKLLSFHHLGIRLICLLDNLRVSQALVDTCHCNCCLSHAVASTYLAAHVDGLLPHHTT